MLGKYGSDSAVKVAAGRTDNVLNSIGAAAAAGGINNIFNDECE